MPLQPPQVIEIKLTHPTPEEVIANSINIDLKVPHIRQERTNWCWAAGIDMVLDHYGKPEVKQTDIADTAFPGGNCSIKGNCNTALDSDSIGEVWRKYNIPPNVTKSFLEKEALLKQLKEVGPVQVIIRQNDTGRGHSLIVFGVQNVQKGEFFLIHDPLSDQIRTTYNNLKKNDMDSWVATIMALTKPTL